MPPTSLALTRADVVVRMPATRSSIPKPKFNIGHEIKWTTANGIYVTQLISNADPDGHLSLSVVLALYIASGLDQE